MSAAAASGSAATSQPPSNTLSPPLVLTTGSSSNSSAGSTSRPRPSKGAPLSATSHDASTPVAAARSDRRIPVYVRLVPRDIWLRMHIDLHSTMGSVKDAVLERAAVPLDDPTLHAASLEALDSASAMHSPGGGGSGNEKNATMQLNAAAAGADTLPRAFIARRAGLVAAPIAPISADASSSSSSAEAPLGLWDATHSLAKASARDRAKAAAASIAATTILGGDAGRGGPGKLGSLGSGMPAMLAATTSVGMPSASELARKAAYVRSSTASAQTQRIARPMASFSALGAVATSRGVQRSASAAPPSNAATPTEERPSAIAASEAHQRHNEGGRAAYDEYLAHGLPGNAEAKRLEAEALARAMASPSLSASTSMSEGADVAPVGGAGAGSAPSQQQQRKAARVGAAAGTARFDPFDSDEEAGGSTSEEESLWSVVEDEAVEGGSGSGGFAGAEDAGSSPSLSSLEHRDEALRTADEEALWGTQLEEANERRARDAAAAAANITPMMTQRSTMGNGSRRESDASIAQSSERGRSGTITAASAAAARGQHAQPLSRVGSATGEASTMPASSRMARVGSEEVSLPHTSTSSLSSSLSAPAASAEGSASPIHASPARNLAALRSGGGRLAGIRLDEISAWDKARHPHSARYAVYSFANGHLMEDWRTVAAFHVRPFELLEVHYARQADRIHLPRMGEAQTEVKSADAAAARGGEGALRHQRDTSHAGNPALDEKYVEPFSEGWYYVLKPGSGSGKAQKAGLCMWKLRWVVIRGWRLSIFRQRPKRSVLAQANGVSSWALNTIRWIVTERADGTTSPNVAQSRLASDSMSISFTSNVVSDYSLDEADFAGYNIVSLRALTEFDHRALFNILARAYWRHSSHGDADVGYEVEAWRRRAVVRATIAGKGGTVQPHRAGRQAGRNALARARLRPRGLSRSFDDADRWSSASEEEIFSPNAAFDLHKVRASAVSAGESSKSSGTNYSGVETATRPATATAALGTPQTPPSSSMGNRRSRMDSSQGGTTTMSISPSDRSIHLRGSLASSSADQASPRALTPSGSGTLSSSSSTHNLARSRGFSLNRGARMATPSPEPGALSSGLANLSLNTTSSSTSSPQSKWRNSSGVSASVTTPRATASSTSAAGSGAGFGFGVGTSSTPERASEALLQPHAGANRQSGSFGRARAHTVSAARPLSASSRNSAVEGVPALPSGAGQLSGKASGLFKGFRKARN